MSSPRQMRAIDEQSDPSLRHRNRMLHIHLEQRIPHRPHQIGDVDEMTRLVRMTALIAWPKPAPKNITPSSNAPATILHFTHAESAIASRDKIAIQITEETNRLPAIQRFVHVQLRSRQAGLHGEQNQPRHPCDLRKQNRQHRRFAQHVLQPAKTDGRSTTAARHWRDPAKSTPARRMLSEETQTLPAH